MKLFPFLRILLLQRRRVHRFIVAAAIVMSGYTAHPEHSPTDSA